MNYRLVEVFTNAFNECDNMTAVKLHNECLQEFGVEGYYIEENNAENLNEFDTPYNVLRHLNKDYDFEDDFFWLDEKEMISSATNMEDLPFLNMAIMAEYYAHNTSSLKGLEEFADWLELVEG